MIFQHLWIYIQPLIKVLSLYKLISHGIRDPGELKFPFFVILNVLVARWIQQKLIYIFRQGSDGTMLWEVMIKSLGLTCGLEGGALGSWWGNCPWCRRTSCNLQMWQPPAILKVVTIKTSTPHRKSLTIGGDGQCFSHLVSFYSWPHGKTQSSLKVVGVHVTSTAPKAMRHMLKR